MERLPSSRCAITQGKPHRGQGEAQDLGEVFAEYTAVYREHWDSRFRADGSPRPPARTLPTRLARAADFLWREPRPFDRASAYGPAIAGDATHAWLCTPDGVWHASALPAETDLTADVLDGPQSIVWEQAENRLHAQKAVLARLIV